MSPNAFILACNFDNIRFKNERLQIRQEQRTQAKDRLGATTALGHDGNSFQLPVCLLSTLVSLYSLTHLPSYRQNPNVKETLNPTGDPQFTLQGVATKQLNQHTRWNAITIPIGPSGLLPDVSILDPPIQRIIVEARSLFASRPIWTRRALFNNLSASDLKALGWSGTRHIQQYVGYCFDSGPWRDAIVRFGVDPRTDPKYRIYQTMTFQLEPQPPLGHSKGEATLTRRDWKTVAELHHRQSHLFDGKEVHTDGKTWQVCDVTDPLLSKIFATATLREKCHSKLDGWYQNGVFAKAKVIIKFKMRGILEGRTLLDEELGFFETLPDTLDQDTRGQWAFEKNAIKNGMVNAELVSMLSDMRAVSDFPILGSSQTDIHKTAMRTQDGRGRYGMEQGEAHGAGDEEDEINGNEEVDLIDDDDEEAEEGLDLEEETEAFLT